ncbi:hydroxymethylglutaryl-CoA reductase [Patescibacteria group bacterium]
MRDFLKKRRNIVDDVVSGKSSFGVIPEGWSEQQKVGARREVVSKISKGIFKSNAIDEEVIDEASGRSCEQIIGITKVPMGVVGPVSFLGGESIFIPLSTTEGALVASVQRGIKALNLSKRQSFLADDKGMTRAPVFVVNDLQKALEVKKWIKEQKTLSLFNKLIRKTSKHIKLKKTLVKIVGKNLFVKFFFDTESAMGMNMATIAADVLVSEIESKFEILCASLSGNGCVDKKPSWGTVIEGRGFYIQYEAVLPEKIVESVLKTTPGDVVEVVHRKNFVGGASFGSMGFNAHFANVVAAYFLATGQDMAHVVEGSVGITTAEKDNNDLYFSVTLPNILLGVVGGGTELPTQRQALEIMGIDDRSRESKYLAARNLGAVVLAGELSLISALASKSLASAHEKLGRKK